MGLYGVCTCGTCKANFVVSEQTIFLDRVRNTTSSYRSGYLKSVVWGSRELNHCTVFLT